MSKAATIAILALSLLPAVGCSAPAGETACEGYCSNMIRCGADVSERGCMWACLAGVEHRKSKGRRCSRAARDEVACLGRTDDCDFLLNAATYQPGDPCARYGNRRSNACEEDGIPADELVPIEGLSREDVSTYLTVRTPSESEASP